MLMNFLMHLLSLDLPWLAALVMNNLPFLFMFAAAIYIFFDGKKLIVGVVLLSLVVWAWQDFVSITGLVLFVASFLMLYYVTKLVVIAFAENSPGLRNKLILVSEAQAIGLLIFFNLFLR